MSLWVRNIARRILEYLDARVSERATPSQVRTEVDGEFTERGATATRFANLDNLDVAVSTRSSHSVGDVWGYPTRALTFKEIFDGIVPAGTMVKPTVSGIFSCALNEPYLSVLLYSDAAGVWRYLRMTTRGIEAVVGEANKIEFLNEDTYDNYMVLVCYG